MYTYFHNYGNIYQYFHNHENLCYNVLERRSTMCYRKKIIEMIEEIQNEDYLFKIYHYILAKYRKEKETED